MVNGCVCIESKFLLWKTLRTSFQMAIDALRQQVVEAQGHSGRFACSVGWIRVSDTVDGCNQSDMPFSGSLTSLFLVGQTTRRWCSWYRRYRISTSKMEVGDLRGEKHPPHGTPQKK